MQRCHLPAGQGGETVTGTGPGMGNLSRLETVLRRCDNSRVSSAARSGSLSRARGLTTLARSTPHTTHHYALHTLIMYS